LPFIASVSSARAPADTVLPLPAVLNQCIARDGPAWKTPPPAVAKNQPWLSSR